MKKRLVPVLVAGLLALPSLGGASAAGGVEPKARVPTFSNCRQLHHRWVYGVAVSFAAARRQVNSGHFRPHVSRAGYRANDHLDADNDGTACEVLR